MKQDKEKIFCIDTSALVRMHQFYPKTIIPDLWDLLGNLFKNKKIISHDFVYDEIVPASGTKDDLAVFVSNFKSNFFSITKVQAQLIPEILTDFPQLIDPKSKKDQADPWLISMVRELNNSLNLFGNDSVYSIVSEESTASSTKIPAACKHYNIQHLTLFEFYKVNGWKLSISETQG